MVLNRGQQRLAQGEKTHTHKGGLSQPLTVKLKKKMQPNPASSTGKDTQTARQSQVLKGSRLLG